MKLILLKSTCWPNQWVLHVPDELNGFHRAQYFWSWQGAIDYIKYLLKNRNYDWKTIHK
jgi:hypothetical protein